MRRKFLSVVLCVCMMLTMAPFAFAEGVSSGGGGGGSSSSVSATDTWSENKTGDLTITKDNAVIDGNGMTYTNGTITVSSTNVTIKNLTFGNGASLKVNADTFTLVGCTFNSTTKIRTPVTLNVSNATVTGNSFDATQENGDPSYYNAIEFTVNAGTSNARKLQSATLSGNTFNAAITNNYFSAYYFENNAKVTVENNTIKLQNKESNAIRISNSAQATGVEFTLNNNSYDYGTGPDSEYEGFILLQDFSNSDTQDFTSFTINISNLMAPESAKTLFYVYSDKSKSIITTNQPIVKGDSSIAKFFSARIGDTYYKTLEAALEAASTGNTVALLKDAHVASSISIAKAVTIDLQGKDISLSEDSTADLFTLASGANLTIKSTGDANGTISVPTTTYNAVVNVGNNSTFTLESGKVIGDYTVFAGKVTGATINVNGGSIEGNYGITAYGTGTLNDVIINVTGGEIKSTSQAAISTNGGSDKGGVNLTVTGGRIISEDGLGIYLPGINGKTTVTNGTITGKTAIELRAGDLIVSGGSITGTGHPVSVNPNGSGSTTDGVGISVAQHTTKRNTSLTISGGTISGFSAIYESNPQNNNADDLAKVTLNITGGNFAAINGGTLSVYSKDKTGFITGGYFTTDPSAYCVDGKTGVSTGKADYPYTVGDKKTDSQPATVDSATVPAKTTSNNNTVKEVASSISGATVENNNATEAATKDIANENKITADTNISTDSQEKKVSAALNEKVSDANKTTDANPVAIVYQTYVDVTVTDAKKSDTSGTTALSELSVELTPMYRVVATTKNVAESTTTEIKLAGNDVIDANAIQIGEPQKLNVPDQEYIIKLALPSNLDTTGGKLSIKHTKENGSIEYYTGIVSTEGTAPDTKTYVTFTTNGFSPFVIYAASQSAASVNGVIYPSFQEAVNAAQSNDVITLLKSGDVSATMTGSSKTIKVKASSGVTTPINVTVNGESKILGDGTAEVTFSYTRPSSGGPGSSGGSISTPTTYAVNVNAATNGAVAADKKTASKGTTVTVTASPSKGYVVDAVKVVDKDGKDVAVTEKDGKYVFTMPASAVTVTGSFKAETPAPVALPFTDVKSGNWFYDAVQYAYAQGLMTGTSATTFAPNGTMNRAMIVTVLYRLEKSPAVTGASKFTDVPAGQWYSDAVAWAAANKIVNGYDETTFGPMNAVTREQMAAILFRYEQVKGLENVTLEENLNRFPDQNKISAYAIPALQWAVGQKIINGNADGTLDPTGTATRAQVAQIFTNLLNK